jgi:hypothetical protein
LHEVIKPSCTILWRRDDRRHTVVKFPNQIISAASFALRRPISLLTMVVAVALVGSLALDRMSRNIFPELWVPVLYVAQPYGGMDPAQMEGFILL